MAATKRDGAIRGDTYKVSLTLNPLQPVRMVRNSKGITVGTAQQAARRSVTKPPIVRAAQQAARTRSLKLNPPKPKPSAQLFADSRRVPKRGGLVGDYGGRILAPMTDVEKPRKKKK
jgi:hypothetical protein